MSTKQKKYRPALLILAVVFPGLIISSFGLLSISQQEKAKELKIQAKYSVDLDYLRKEVEEEIDTAVNNAFQPLTKNPLQFQHPDSFQQALKEILLKNPIVKYPFLIDARGEYIFPFSRKSQIPVLVPPFPHIAHKEIEFFYRNGERLEFQERKFQEALKSFVKCLEFPASVRLKPYIFNAIGRCYFKLDRFPQAISYYQSIIDFYSTLPLADRDFSLYFPALRQIARSDLRTRGQGVAVKTYLQLYDEILQYETSYPGDKFAFYKNEALEFLNQYVLAYRKIPNEDNTLAGSGVSPDRLQEFTSPEISLRWQYFENSDIMEEVSSTSGINDAGTSAFPAQKSDDLLRFMKIREFYLAADEKTQFYKAVKELGGWVEPGETADNTGATDIPDTAASTTASPDNDIITKRIELPGTIDKAVMVFKKFPTLSAGPVPNHQHFFFGFQLSIDFLNSARIFNIFSRFAGDGLRLAVVPDNYLEAGFPAGREQDFPLLAAGLEKFFPGRSLVLISSERNFFARRAREEIRLNYLLMGGFILVLILGVYLFYKYLTREAELVRLKSEFTDQASHSLKTPLTRIRMIAEKLQLGWVSSEAKKQEYLRTILTETDRMNEMIVNMLDFSKIEAGRKHYHFEEKSLPLVVQEALEDYSPYIRNLGFQLHIEIAADIPLFPLDAEAIKLILINLLQNAIKYSPTEKSIKVRLFREEDTAVLVVEDRGIGIAEKDLKRIFERFYRSGVEAVQTVEGSGLGLFLVQHAVQAHHGSIDVTCSPGKGSVFTVSLPIKNFYGGLKGGGFFKKSPPIAGGEKEI